MGFVLMSHTNLHYLRETDAVPRQNNQSPLADEVPFQSLNGYPMTITGLLVIALTLYSFFNPPQLPNALTILARIVLLLSGTLLLLGLYMLHPKQAALLLVFGAYRGTDRAEGLRWANPFY